MNFFFKPSREIVKSILEDVVEEDPPAERIAPHTLPSRVSKYAFSIGRVADLVGAVIDAPQVESLKCRIRTQGLDLFGLLLTQTTTLRHLFINRYLIHHDDQKPGVSPSFCDERLLHSQQILPQILDEDEMVSDKLCTLSYMLGTVAMNSSLESIRIKNFALNTAHLMCAGTSIMLNRTLRSIRFEACDYYSQPDEGLIFFIMALGASNITSFEWGAGILEFQERASHAMADMIKTNTKLKTFALRGSEGYDDGLWETNRKIQNILPFFGLCHSTSITTLDLSYLVLETRHIEDLLNVNTSLWRVLVNLLIPGVDNNFPKERGTEGDGEDEGDEGEKTRRATIIANFIARSKTIEYVDAGISTFFTRNFHPLSDALKMNHTLTRLIITFDLDTTQEEFDVLIDGMTVNTSLVEFQDDSNYMYFVCPPHKSQFLKTVEQITVRNRNINKTLFLLLSRFIEN